MTSLDTNVILAAFDPQDASHQAALTLLDRVGAGGVVLCPVVYAELAASQAWEALKTFLQRTEAEVLWEMPQAVWERAGSAMGAYARMRRHGALPRRIAADFLIGAHAEHHGLRLATLDPVIYRTVFEGVPLLRP
ncbi:MAG: type II toxin-antitoxin system VapC family toxin [Armatimonadota bacterium]|nr:type II toxin-antitoxin system VapC family toxin [Armatimonadota bacterium]MDR7478551.1 type II toxin-antitoxin system VapC family toxin [Armatimonadota bacterium]MDR7487722.1 type II toxin-antitoxin system VapC family toxin [Armatimonadota bacterium]MDR7491894.1 type II toxin-antitoxin system VapC family toxin [Armatimonadota bacterium]MDR7500781.1 type II toxin-antitoxin system VapC family toxin [Armatimonadota bacterium]